MPLGSEVGYAVRFRDRSSRDTQVRLMTDGLLLAEIRRDKLLKRYDTIIVDEAHERSLNIDFLLGYLARMLPRRPRPEGDHHVGDDRPASGSAATSATRRWWRCQGRTYPVEVRYRPVEDPDRDQEDAIADACDELLREGPGDVLVFLSGEREIRDTADVLRGRLDVEVLPLYARLSASEQQRVFKPHAKRRVVLATNVAETSLTVPGIRYVVDPGTARISRYSARLKVQRLPIEPISQASADQRKGRCGRTSDGICIRLYAEEDFLERPRFTDPEILRTNLASVILQMAAIGLGRVEDFPFLDPPDKRQIRDGIRLLEELGALDASGRLTKVGRRLAELPVDPRMARMVVEADRLGCAEEVIVIAAALSIQDPRERPSDQTAQADQLHARFADPDSDFVAFLNLWRYLKELQRQLSSNQFRKRCLAEHLHHLRVREWQDLVAQLREAAKGVGVRFNRTPAEPAGDPPGAAGRAAVARGDEGRRVARVHGRARRAVRDLPRLGAVQEAAELGDGGRAGGDDAAVGPGGGADRSGRRGAAGRAPGQAHLQRAALGSAPRVGGGDRAGDAVRTADRHRPHGAVRADRPGALARALHPARAGRGRVGDPARVRGGEPAAGRGGRGAGAPGAAAGHPGRRPGAVRVLRRAGAFGCGLGGGVRPLVAGPAPGSAHVHAGRARPLPRCGRRADVAVDVAPGRADPGPRLPLRAGRSGRRRDGGRAAAAARRRAAGPLRVARPGAARGARHDAHPRTAEGAAAAAGAGAGDSRARVGAARTAAPATGRGSLAGDRHLRHPARGVGLLAAPAAPAGDVPRGRLEARRARLRQVTERRARAGAPAAAGRADRRLVEARADAA